MHPKFWLLVFGDFLRVLVVVEPGRSVTRCRETRGDDGRRDGVARDGVDVAVRDSARLAREPRQFATASLHTGYDNKMNNQFWVCDFPRRTTPMVQQATPEAEVDDRDAARVPQGTDRCGEGRRSH